MRNEIRKKPLLLIYHLSFLIFILFSCSSSPDLPEEVFSIRNMASRQLDLANRTATQGRFGDALLIVEDARRLALSTDDPVLLIQTATARANFLFSLGRYDEAFQNWEAARDEGEIAGFPDLAILAQIYSARGRLMLLNNPTEAAVLEIQDQIRFYISSIRSDPQVQASGWLVMGMVEKELQHYSEAEAAARRSLDIHVRNRNLEDAAYDWYFIASIHSVAGRYDDALAALRNAINYDRRAENGYGLASSWEAMGEVYIRTGNYTEAARAFNRAADIYQAIGLEDLSIKAAARSQN